MASKPFVVIGGALANRPWNGGNAWARLSLVRGLERLGFEAWLVEELRAPTPDAIAFFELVSTRFDLKSVLLDGEQQVLLGHWDELLAVAEASDLLINVGGHLKHRRLINPIRSKVYLDDDPGFTQVWEASGQVRTGLDSHDIFFTFGSNIGLEGCSIPTGAIAWHPMRPPVVLEDWPLQDHGGFGRFTTVATWRSPYGRLRHGDHLLGLKAHEFRRFVELPRLVDRRFELALDIHPDERSDLELLRSNGWGLVDPREVAGTPEEFSRYVQGSGAEFSAAQGAYVETNSGWFSDRSTRYLASGRPVLVQETGFSRTIPTGEGLLTFRTLDDAVVGANAIAGDYERHARAARQLAEEYFDSDKVLNHLLDVALP